MARLDEILESLGGLLGANSTENKTKELAMGQGLIGGQGPFEELDSFNFSQPVNVKPVDPLMQDFKRSQDFSMTDPGAMIEGVRIDDPNVIHDPLSEIAPDRRTDQDKLSILDAATRAKVLSGEMSLTDAIAPGGDFIRTADGKIQGLLKKTKSLKGDDKEGFLKNLFNDRASMLQLALAFNTMRLEPDQGLAKSLTSELASIQKQSAKGNSTYAYLKKTRPDLYNLVVQDQMKISEAVSIAKLDTDKNVKGDRVLVRDANGNMKYEIIPGSKTAEEKEEAKTKQRMSLKSKQAKTDLISNEVGKAIGILQTEEWATGVKGAFIREHGGFLAAGSPAVNLEATITSIKANIGFDRLQVMREESPTGGALGQVAVQELVALQATLGSLDLRQSPELVIATLKNVKATYDKNMAIVLQQYGAEEMRKYGVPVPGEQNNNDPLGIR